MPSPSETSEQACPVHGDCPVGLACAPSRAALCEGIESMHSAKLAICHVLEAIADSLPNAVDRHACLWAASALLPAVREAHRFEEDKVYPAFERGPDNTESLRRLRAEHIVDEALAEEVTESLLFIGRGGEAQNPEALGFMLRSFFESVRRHIAFEREHVLPIVERGIPD